MADPISDLHMVLIICGVSVKATSALIINNEALTSIAEFGFLDVCDVALPKCRRVWRVM